MAWLSIDIRCENCGELDEPILVQPEDRNEPQVCPECGGNAVRSWSAVQVRTEKLSESYVDGTTRRFDGVRLSEKLKRAKKKAKHSGDFKLEKEISREIKRRIK